MTDNAILPADGTPVNLLTNGNFETGSIAPWVSTTIGSPIGQCPSSPRDFNVSTSGYSTGCSPAANPIGGSYALYNMLDGDNPLTYRIYQSVSIPTNITVATLGWRESWRTSYNGASRTMRIDLYNSTGTTHLTTLYSYAFPSIANSNGWQTRNIDITSAIQAQEDEDVRVVISVAIPSTWTGPAGLGLDNFALDVRGGSSTVVQVGGLPSGSIFPVGTTTNTFLITDGSGNTTSCSFDVNVNRIIGVIL